MVASLGNREVIKSRRAYAKSIFGDTPEASREEMALIDADAHLIAASPEMHFLLDWVSKCPAIEGPAGTTAYIIKDEVMEAIKKVMERIES
jgi:hypothetical protein